jgi:hypothetical protein
LEGIALTPDGGFWVTDLLLRRVSKFNASGVFERKIDGIPNTPFLLPFGLAIDAKGNLYVAEPGLNAVFMFSPGGSFVRFWQDDDMLFPFHMAFDGAGDLLVTASPGQVLRIDMPDPKPPLPPIPPPEEPPVLTPPVVAPPPVQPVQRTTLRLRLKPRTVKVRRGGRATFRSTVTNTGTVVASGVKVCFKAPKRAKGKVKAKGCTSVAALKAGGSARVKLRLWTTRKARGTYGLNVTMTAGNAPTRATKGRLKVR